jgi:UDP-N-acetylglucosamine--N-acetylmuramyl-(pentapeptide) pyrophosphoryl-undecaprenol N-acetylglucosamine transferase
MGLAYSAADVVIARAGFGTLTELAVFSKPAIIIPMANTHQEQNANFLSSKKAIIQFSQEGANGLKLAHVVTRLVQTPKKCLQLGEHLHKILPQTSEEKIVEIIDRVIS